MQKLEQVTFSAAGIAMTLLVSPERAKAITEFMLEQSRKSQEDRIVEQHAREKENNEANQN